MTRIIAGNLFSFTMRSSPAGRPSGYCSFMYGRYHSDAHARLMHDVCKFYTDSVSSLRSLKFTNVRKASHQAASESNFSRELASSCNRGGSYSRCLFVPVCCLPVFEVLESCSSSPLLFSLHPHDEGTNTYCHADVVLKI